MQIVFEFQSAFTDMQRRESLVSQSGSRRNPGGMVRELIPDRSHARRANREGCDHCVDISDEWCLCGADQLLIFSGYYSCAAPKVSHPSI
jgi:hypothetical protein